VKFKKMLANKRLYLVLIIRLIVYPIIVLVALKCVQMGINVANEDKILLITYLASITPSAATVVQLAQVNNSNEEYAVSINIGTTLLCIATMPIFVALYQMW
ncbi:MAG: AEC family transporter, partial [Clostridia bacterium]|nr:AEC family transporter [Clostridia bacterium]